MWNYTETPPPSLFFFVCLKKKHTKKERKWVGSVSANIYLELVTQLIGRFRFKRWIQWYVQRVKPIIIATGKARRRMSSVLDSHTPTCQCVASSNPSLYLNRYPAIILQLCNMGDISFCSATTTHSKEKEELCVVLIFLVPGLHLF